MSQPESELTPEQIEQARIDQYDEEIARLTNDRAEAVVRRDALVAEKIAVAEAAWQPLPEPPEAEVVAAAPTRRKKA